MNAYTISKGYGPFILKQRLSYNDMNMREWRASFVYGLPDFGDSLAKDLFPIEDYARFDYSNPDGFYMMASAALSKEATNGETPEKDELSTLFKRQIFGNLFQHTIVTLSLAWRGMWISKYWGLIAIPLFLGVFAYALRTGWAAFLALSLPPWFMLGLHAFTSVNVPRYNLILIPCLAIAVAFFLHACYALAGRFWRRNKTSRIIQEG